MTETRKTKQNKKYEDKRRLSLRYKATEIAMEQSRKSQRVRAWSITPLFNVKCAGDMRFPPSFDMVCKLLKDRLIVKLTIFPVLNGRNDE